MVAGSPWSSCVHHTLPENRAKLLLCWLTLQTGVYFSATQRCRMASNMPKNFVFTPFCCNFPRKKICTNCLGSDPCAATSCVPVHVEEHLFLHG